MPVVNKNPRSLLTPAIDRQIRTDSVSEQDGFDLDLSLLNSTDERSAAVYSTFPKV